MKVLVDLGAKGHCEYTAFKGHSVLPLATLKCEIFLCVSSALAVVILSVERFVERKWLRPGYAGHDGVSLDSCVLPLREGSMQSALWIKLCVES